MSQDVYYSDFEAAMDRVIMSYWCSELIIWTRQENACVRRGCIDIDEQDVWTTPVRHGSTTVYSSHPCCQHRPQQLRSAIQCICSLSTILLVDYWSIIDHIFDGSIILYSKITCMQRVKQSHNTVTFLWSVKAKLALSCTQWTVYQRNPRSCMYYIKRIRV